jgi:hypothetical protein
LLEPFIAFRRGLASDIEKHGLKNATSFMEVVAVDDDGCFTERITDLKGCNIKIAENGIIQAVKARKKSRCVFFDLLYFFLEVIYGEKFLIIVILFDFPP